MFSAGLDALLLSLKDARTIQIIPAARDRARWDGCDSRLCSSLLLRAERAQKERTPPLYFGDLTDLYENGHSAYRKDRLYRREILKALIVGHAVNNGAYAARLADLSWELMDEYCWADPAAFGANGYANSELVDESALEAAETLACLTQVVTDERLTPVLRRAEREIARRVLRPFVQKGMRGDAHSVLSVLVAALITPGDDHERWQAVRRCVLLIDEILDDKKQIGLEEAMSRAADIARCLELIHLASGGEVDFRGDERFRSLAHLPCSMHIGSGWFVNPGGESMRPKLNLYALHATGRAAGDHELQSLASFLNRRAAIKQNPFDVKSGPLCHQLLNAADSEGLNRTPARTPLTGSVKENRLRAVTRRQDGFFVALTGGGDFTLFHGDEPVVIGAGSVAAYGGKGPVRACAPRDIEREDGIYSLISMNLAGVYPEGVNLGSYQRSVMFMPFDESVRLMDVYEFDRARKAAEFVFISPCEIEVFDGYAVMGPVKMEWENGLSARASSGKGGADFERVYRLTLTTEESGLGGNYTFTFRGRISDE